MKRAGTLNADLLEIGICTRTHSDGVLYQNNLSASICGSKVGAVCAEGCIALAATVPQHRGNESRARLFPHRFIHGRHFDVVMLRSAETVTTVLNPDDKAPQSLLTAMEKADLTHREEEILELMLEGLSNREILKKLFISRATLKTHINRIYRKLGPEHQNLLSKRG